MIGEGGRAVERMTVASLLLNREETLSRLLRDVGLRSVLTGLGGSDMSVRARRRATPAFEDGMVVRVGRVTWLSCERRMRSLEMERCLVLPTQDSKGVC